MPVIEVGVAGPAAGECWALAACARSITLINLFYQILRLEEFYEDKSN
jgi:hypothetical protein